MVESRRAVLELLRLHEQVRRTPSGTSRCLPWDSLLFGVLAEKTEMFGVPCAPEILLSPWCVGEMITARQLHVDTVFVILAEKAETSVVPCTAEIFHRLDVEHEGVLRTSMWRRLHRTWIQVFNESGLSLQQVLKCPFFICQPRRVVSASAPWKRT